MLPFPLIKFLWLGVCLYGCTSASYLLVCLHLKWFFLIREEIKRRVNRLTNGVCGRNNTLKNSRQKIRLTFCDRVGLLFLLWFSVFPLLTKCFTGIRKVHSVAKGRKMGIDNETFDSFVTERSRFLDSAAVPDWAWINSSSPFPMLTVQRHNRQQSPLDTPWGETPDPLHLSSNKCTHRTSAGSPLNKMKKTHLERTKSRFCCCIFLLCSPNT